jgi:hypothetical protein
MGFLMTNPYLKTLQIADLSGRGRIGRRVVFSAFAHLLLKPAGSRNEELNSQAYGIIDAVA